MRLDDFNELPEGMTTNFVMKMMKAKNGNLTHEGFVQGYVSTIEPGNDRA